MKKKEISDQFGGNFGNEFSERTKSKINAFR